MFIKRRYQINPQRSSVLSPCLLNISLEIVNIVNISRILVIVFIVNLSLFFNVKVVFCSAKKVIATGASYLKPGEELVAREKALDEARRNALEKAVGTYIKSTTVVENFYLVEDKIISRTKGYLKNIRILKEGKTNLGTYELTIEAEVTLDSLKDDIGRFKKLISLQKNPRVFVRLDPRLKKTEFATANKVKTILVNSLQRDGFVVLAKEPDKTDAGPSLVVELGTEFESTLSEYKGINIKLNELSCVASLIRPGDNTILATAMADASVPGENKIQLIDRMSKKCAVDIWTQLKTKLLSIWEEELYGQRDIKLVIKSIPSYSAARKICLVIKEKVPGVKAIKLLKFRRHVGIYHLKYNGWPEYLINDMSMSFFQYRYFSFKTVSLEGNKILISLKKIKGWR